MQDLQIIKALLFEQDAEEKAKTFEEDPMNFILDKYQNLHEILVYLMGENYRDYLKAVFIVAPKPTMFKVVLHNDQYFFMTFMGEAYQATIAGKNYFLLSQGEKQRAMMSIARLLRYGAPMQGKGGEEAEAEAGEESLGAEPEEGGEEAGGGEEEETLQELSILKEIIKTNVLYESPESEILSLLNKNKNISALKPEKVVKSGKNAYKVYFSGINTKDKKGRSDVMTQIVSTKGVKGTLAKGLSSIGHVKINTPSGEMKVMIKGSSETATSTNVKEGLVILFYNSDVNEPVTDKNAKSIISKLKKSISASEGLDPKTLSELGEFLNTIEINKATIAILNQPLSQALAIKKAYKGIQLVRNGLFNDYRSAASKFTGLPADKWCPGDIYGIVNDKKARTILASAMKQDESQAIGILNQAFVEDWGSKKAPIVAISLKFEKAQGGKAKAYFEKFKRAKTEYNLDDKEQNFNEKAYREGIERLRKNILAAVKGNPNIKYELPDKSASSISKDKLRGKYAALKAMNFFFTQVQQSEGIDAIDDSLLALAAFAMSLGDVSPTFFKLIASTKGGEGEVEKFEGGSALSLYIDDKIEPIKISDSSTFGGLVIEILASKKKDENIKITLNARNNGLTQGTIEVASIKHI